MRIAVVGDVLLDVDVEGTSTRLSPDAAVPVVDIASRAERAGGAGLVARMLAVDGHDVALVTALSDDPGGQTLRQLLRGVRVVAGPSHAPTPVKTRVRVDDRHVGRLDEGCSTPPVPEATSEMLAEIARADAVVVADYGRGITAVPEIRAALERVADSVPIVWDPHPRGTRPLAAAWLATPNLAEAGPEAPASDAARDAARSLLADWGCRAVAVTLGEEGAQVHTADGDEARIPADAIDAMDPCGAGDRFAAGAAVALARGASTVEAVRSAVASAGAYLAAGGVASLPPVAADVALGTRDPWDLARSVRERGGTVVATGGCFDLLHAGHVRTLQTARAMGDCLIVCLNADASVRRLKGPSRPLISAQERAELLDALACVDGVVVFDEDTPLDVIADLRPHIWVKGGDYSAEALPEAKLLGTWGGRAVTVPYHLGRSTTALAAALVG